MRERDLQELMRRHVPVRLDGEPLMLKGLTRSELMLAIKIFGVVWLPVSLFLAIAVFGVFPLAIGIYVLGAAGTLYFTAVSAMRFKRNKPRGYLGHMIHLKGYEWGILPALPFIYRAGHWELGRPVSGAR